MPERVLTQRDLNRAVLARQLLLERAPLPIPKAVERLAGIQNQYAPNGYIRLWSCLADFGRDDLTRAIESRSVIHASVMRSTIHLLSRPDYWPFISAIRQSQKDWWLRTARPQNTEAEMVEAAAKLRAVLSDGPRPQKELGGGWGLAGPWLDLVRVPPAGTWGQRRANVYGLAEDWVGPDDADPDTGAELLVRRYLGGFGPATKNDIAGFTGIPLTPLKPLLDRLELRRFRNEAGKELHDVPGAPLPDPDTPAPVRFLPTWDAVLLVHARRSGVLPEEYRPRIFHTKAPQSYPTFLVDGRVAGTWKYAEGRIELDPFERQSKETQRELAEEGERLAEFHR